MDKIREILVLDAEQSSYQTLCGLLNQTGLEPSSVIHIADLDYTMLQETSVKPDVIFASSQWLDEYMLEVFEQRFPAAVVIILGESADRDMAVYAAKAGAHDYLVKWDFDAEALARSLQFSLEWKREQIRMAEANSRFELANKATNEIIWDSDLKSGVTYMTGRKEIFGYPLSITLEKGWWESHLHPDDSHRVLFNLEKHISSGLDNWSDYYRFKGADGSYRYIHDRGYMMWDAKGLPLRMIGAMNDITYEMILKHQAEEEIREKHRREIAALLEMTENEKHGAGLILHDHILQLLAVIKMMNMSVYSSMAQKDERLKKAIELIDESLLQTRKLSSSLTPVSLHEWGLGESIEMLVNDLKGESNTEFVIVLPEPLLQRLPEVLQMHFYCIAHEQLKNIISHADATEVYIVLDVKDGEIHFTISDNGNGFDPSSIQNGGGFLQIKARTELFKGRYNLESFPEKGCTLHIAVPEPAKNN